MTKKTFYVVQPFEAGKRGRIRAGIPMEARSAEDADRKAKRFGLVKVGASPFRPKWRPRAATRSRRCSSPAMAKS